MMGGIEEVGVSLAKLALDGAALRHEAIAQNLANAQSENYTPVSVSFESQLAALRESLKGLDAESRAQALEDARPRVEPDLSAGAGPRPEEIDLEMVKLAENTVHYQALIHALGMDFSILGAAIDGGKG
jgi:flagellar basal-body rod protein FlgB